jgi:hypothetical protein
MHITVKSRDVYGVTKYYPHCDNAKTFAKIAGTTTLTELTLMRIAELGYDIKVEQPVKLYKKDV